MEIKDIIKLEKMTLISQKGEMTAKIIIEKDNGVAIFCLIWSNDKEKEGLRKKMMEMIKKTGITKYWFSSTAWVSIQDKKDKGIYKRPSRDVNRKEALIITEFNKIKGSKVFFQFYKKIDNGVEFEKEENFEKGKFDSYWNAWEDEEELDKKMNGFIDNQNKEFFENIKKEVMKKYKKEIDNCKNDLEFMEIIKKAIKDVDEMIAKQNKTILEDVNETEN